VPDFELLRPFLYFFGLFVIAGLGAPIPEEVAIVGAGLWTGTCDPAVYGVYKWLMLPVCLLGVLIADGLLYGGGWYFGTRLFEKRWMARIVSPSKRQEIQDNFHRYGVSILIFGRLLPGIRAPLFLIAGTMRLSLTRFFLADGIGAVLGNSLLFFLAFWFGDQFKELIDPIQREAEKVRPILILLAISAVGAYLLYHFLRRPVTTGDPVEIPLIGSQVANVIEHADSHASRELKSKKDSSTVTTNSRHPEQSVPAPPSSEARG
jgi:membrane protein DedA with SNARE-associated domain